MNNNLNNIGNIKMLSFYEKTSFGSHIPFSKNLENTYISAIDNGMYSFQFFLGGKLSYTRSSLKNEDIDKTLLLQEKYPINVFTHCSLVYNLAGSVKNNSLAWVGNSEVDSTMDKIISGIEKELETTSKFCKSGCKNGCVVHVGSWKEKNEGMKTISKTINKINFPKNSTLLLENTAGKGTTIGKTLDELKFIYDLIDDNKKENVKFCIDTCHIYASGVYDLKKNIEIDKMFNDVESTFGLDKIGLFHFNDSFYEYGTNGDQHMNIGTGKIWGESTSSCKYLLDKIDKLKIPLVLETEPSDMEVIQKL